MDLRTMRLEDLATHYAAAARGDCDGYLEARAELRRRDEAVKALVEAARGAANLLSANGYPASALRSALSDFQEPSR